MPEVNEVDENTPETEKTAPPVELQGEIQAPYDPIEVAQLADQKDGDDKAEDQSRRDDDGELETRADGTPKDPPPTAQQTEPAGVIAGETAAETAVKRHEGSHRHDENVGWDHRGPVGVDASDDPDSPNEGTEKQ